jgi:signal-transduction protein with cAMP-binding, CBS, and nucleotidyltransferase domain
MLKNIIRLELFSVKPEDGIDQVVRLMKEENIGSVLVCDDQKKPLGIITDRDLVLRCLGEDKDFHQCRVKDLMTSSPRTVSENDGLFDCINAMHDEGVRRIPVVDQQGKALGIVSFGDILKILSKEFNALVESTTRPLEPEKYEKKAAAA